MIKCNSELFKSSVSLTKGFSIHTKEELKIIAKILKLTIPTRLKKDEFAEVLAYGVLNFTDKWLPILSSFELRLLKKLIEVGPNTYVESTDEILANALEHLALVATERFPDQGTIRYMICDELREAITPFISTYVGSKEEITNSTIQQYTLGILNLYGYISYIELIELLNEYLSDSISKSEIVNGIENSCIFSRFRLKLIDNYTSTICIQSPFLTDMDKLQEELFEYRSIKEKKHFTKEEVFMAGMMPVIQIPVKGLHEIKRFMMKYLGCTETKAELDLQYLWFALQLNANYMPIITSIINGKLQSMKELQNTVEVLIDYCNKCPIWSFKGYSPNEISKLINDNKVGNSPSNASKNTRQRNRCTETSSEAQLSLDNLFQKTNPEMSSKVGRNDPCPCGSGKKYKKCCG